MHWMKYHFNGKDERVLNAEEGELEREVGRDRTLAPWEGGGRGSSGAEKVLGFGDNCSTYNCLSGGRKENEYVNLMLKRSRCWWFLFSFEKGNKVM